jgi:hypothetical protein
MSLIKEKLSRKYTKLAAVAFVIVIAMTFIQFRTLAAITVKSDTVHTNKTTAVIRLDNAESTDKVYVLVPDDAHEGKFKKSKLESYIVGSDDIGKYVNIDIQSITSPYDKVTTVVDGENYHINLAFNVVQNDDITIATEGNPGLEVTHVTVVIDKLNPTILITEGVNITSNNTAKTLNINETLAKNGDTITTTFSTSEAVQKPTVTILNQSANVTEIESKDGNKDGTHWKAEYTIKDNENAIEGLVSFLIKFKDLADNEIVAPVIATTDLSKVIYDRTAPTALTANIVSNNTENTNPTYAINGDKITIIFSTSEMVQNPTATILGKEAIVSGSGINWKAEYNIVDDKNVIPEGKVNFSINFKDLAGNVVTPDVIATTDASTVTYEHGTTAIVDIVSNNINDSKLAKNGDMITITFKTSVPVQLPEVTILGNKIVPIDTDYVAGEPEGGTEQNPIPKKLPIPGKGISWKAQYIIPTTATTIVEGEVEFSINFKNITGNKATSTVTNKEVSSKVTYDRTVNKASEVSITSSNILVNYAKNDQKITVSFTTDEIMRNMNVTIFNRTATAKAVTDANGKTQKWTAEYIIPVGETELIETKVDFKIGFTDLAGNSALEVTTVNDTSSVKYDRTAPVATMVKVTSNNKNPKQAKKGDKITAEFTTSEAIQEPNVTIFGKTTTIIGKGTSWKAEYIIDKSDVTKGDVKFAINFKDLASNNVVSVVTSVIDSVNYEPTIPMAPKVSMVSSNLNPIFAKNGDKVTVSFTTSKFVQLPNVKIQEQKASVKEVNVEGESGKNWIAEYIIPLDESSLNEGNLLLEITLLDIAYNETVVKAVTDTSKVTYDRTATTASTVNIVSNNSNPIYAKNGDKVTLAFNTSEAIQAPTVTILGETPIVTEIESKDATLPETKIKNGTSWIAVYIIKADEKLIKEGQVDFSINFIDFAGNNVASVLTTTKDKSTVTYDRTASTATSVNLVSTNSNPKYAKNGDKITAKFATSEVVQTPTVSIQGQTISTNGDGSGKNWTAEYDIAANENALTEGNIGFSIFFKDLANNEITTAANATTDDSSVNYDRSVPTASKISVVKVKGTSYDKWVKNGDQFKVKFTLADTNSGIKPDDVKYQVGTTELTAPITKGTVQNGEYEAVFTVDSNTLNGIKDYSSLNYTVNFKDAAGNSGLAISDDTGISNDNIAPEIRYFINGVDTNASNLASYYKNNKLIIQVKEHNFDGAQVILENSQIKQTSWVDKGNDIWQMAITVPDGDNYTLKVNATDKVGNLTSNDLTRERPFNIDTTLPVIKYVFNGIETDAATRYYKATQQVAVQIKEHNFDPANAPVSGNGITKTSWENKGNDIWEMALSLGEANDYTLNVSTTDKAENKFEKNLGTFTIDITKPALEIQNIIAGFFNGTLSPRVVYSDKNLDTNAVSIKFNGKEQGAGTAVGTGFENTISIREDGSYDLIASVSDLAGNPSTAEIQFVLDNTAPNIGSTTINLKDPMAFKGGWIIQKELQISDANGYDIVTCTLNGVDWDISKPITNEGKNVIYLEAKDKSGNMSKLSYQFFLDNTPPKLIFKDVISSKSLNDSGSNPIFISEMKLKLSLDKMEIGNEKPDYFTSILLKDKDGKVVEDILHNVTPKIENNLNVYYLPLSEFQTYTLVVNAKDQVGNDLNKDYTFTLKDKSIFTKYYDNKPLLYTTTSLATVIVMVLIGLGIIKLNKKKVEVKE